MEIKKEDGQEAVKMFGVVVCLFVCLFFFFLFWFFPTVGGGEIDKSVKKMNVKGVLRKGRKARKGEKRGK